MVTDAEMGGILRLHLGDGPPTIVYPQPDHVPASSTILTLPVADVEAAVDEVTERGIVFERYEGTPTETDVLSVIARD